MRKRLQIVVGMLVPGLGVALGLGAAEPALKIGDPAPKLQVGRWVQGEPVTGFETGKVYIVEFWATWCGPCRIAIPVLNELQKKYRDRGVIVIGQNVNEPKDEVVEPFVKGMGDQMAYRVALDDKSQDPDGAMLKLWLEAAGLRGVPYAFIVDGQGELVWIGHPMNISDPLLEDILAGRYDPALAVAEAETKERDRVRRLELARLLNTAVGERNWDAAEASINELEMLLPLAMRDSLGLFRFQVLLARTNYVAAYRLANTLSDAHPQDALLQNELAWKIVAHPGLEQRDLVLAEKAAQRANEATGGRSIGVLDTLARVQFMSGKKEAALATIRRAIEVAPPDIRPWFERRLTLYQQDKLPVVMGQ